MPNKKLRLEKRIIAPVALLLEIEGKTEPCFTRNISQGGMFVMTRRPAAKDSIVSIAIVKEKKRFETSARVVSVAEDGLGLRYVGAGHDFQRGVAELLDELLTSPEGKAQQEQGEEPAEVTPIVGWSHIPDGKSWNWWRKGVTEAKLASLSLDGAALLSRRKPEPGETVLVFLTDSSLPDAELHCRATVVRAVDGGFAVMFEKPGIPFKRMVGQLRKAGVADA